MAKTPTKEVSVFDGLNDKYLELVQSPDLMDPSQVSADIAQRILNVDPDATIEDVLALGDMATEDARSITNRPFFVTGEPNWYKSTFTESDGPGVFVALPIHFLDTNTDGVVTVGGSNVVAQLYVMHTRGMVPSSDAAACMKFTTKQSARGYDVLWLTKGEVPF